MDRKINPQEIKTSRYKTSKVKRQERAENNLHGHS